MNRDKMAERSARDLAAAYWRLQEVAGIAEGDPIADAVVRFEEEGHAHLFDLLDALGVDLLAGGHASTQ
jgi:hypothetical protein